MAGRTHPHEASACSYNARSARTGDLMGDVGIGRGGWAGALPDSMTTGAQANDDQSKKCSAQLVL